MLSMDCLPNYKFYTINVRIVDKKQSNTPSCIWQDMNEDIGIAWSTVEYAADASHGIQSVFKHFINGNYPDLTKKLRDADVSIDHLTSLITDDVFADCSHLFGRFFIYYPYRHYSTTEALVRKALNSLDHIQIQFEVISDRDYV